MPQAFQGGQGPRPPLQALRLVLGAVGGWGIKGEDRASLGDKLIHKGPAQPSDAGRLRAVWCLLSAGPPLTSGVAGVSPQPLQASPIAPGPHALLGALWPGRAEGDPLAPHRPLGLGGGHTTSQF